MSPSVITRRIQVAVQCLFMSLFQTFSDLHIQGKVFVALFSLAKLGDDKLSMLGIPPHTQAIHGISYCFWFRI